MNSRWKKLTRLASFNFVLNQWYRQTFTICLIYLIWDTHELLETCMNSLEEFCRFVTEHYGLKNWIANNLCDLWLFSLMAYVIYFRRIHTEWSLNKDSEWSLNWSMSVLPEASSVIGWFWTNGPITANCKRLNGCTKLIFFGRRILWRICSFLSAKNFFLLWHIHY